MLNARLLWAARQRVGLLASGGAISQAREVPLPTGTELGPGLAASAWLVVLGVMGILGTPMCKPGAPGCSC